MDIFNKLFKTVFDRDNNKVITDKEQEEIGTPIENIQEDKDNVYSIVDDSIEKIQDETVKREVVKKSEIDDISELTKITETDIHEYYSADDYKDNIQNITEEQTSPVLEYLKNNRDVIMLGIGNRRKELGNPEPKKLLGVGGEDDKGMFDVIYDEDLEREAIFPTVTPLEEMKPLTEEEIEEEKIREVEYIENWRNRKKQTPKHLLIERKLNQKHALREKN